MKGYISILCLFLSAALYGQTTDGMVAYYDFNDMTANDQTGGGSNGAIVGAPLFVCGVEGDAIHLDGMNDFVRLLGLVSNFFENDDLSIGFFLNPESINGTQTIFSKKEACSDDMAFAIRYSPGPNTITLELSESASKKTFLTATLDFNKCWQHVAFTRAGGTVRLYINGELRETGTTISRINILNAAVLSIAEGPCVGVTDNRYGGLLDEIRIYDRALTAKEVLGLYEPLIPDNIITSDTTIFLGNSVPIAVSKTCADDFLWSPIENFNDSSAYEPIITPTETKVYSLTFSDDLLSCVTSDSIKITVVDPADLDCSKVFMPNAFTPNGDGRNDSYGISNPYAITDLVSLEIFDRWGGRVFMTENPMEQWDGNFKGEPINPGVLLYKVIFRCNGEELLDVGSLSIIR